MDHMKNEKKHQYKMKQKTLFSGAQRQDKGQWAQTAA